MLLHHFVLRSAPETPVILNQMTNLIQVLHEILEYGNEMYNQEGNVADNFDL